MISDESQALQLLEFLVKNGSEQVIDDARSHISTIKMLRQFHFIDMNGKDQGVNVRNRAKELGELLSDVDRIRAERKKARATKNKYGGVEGGGGFGGGFSSGFGGGSGANRSSRYGGFGSDNVEYGGYGSDAVYGDGGGFGGSSSRYDEEHVGGFSGSRGGDNRQKFEEYDEYDEGAPKTSTVRRSQSSTTTSTKASTTAPLPKKTQAAPAVDLLFGDEPAPGSSSNGNAPDKDPLGGLDVFAVNKAATDGDDDFDDFQAAPAPSGTNTSSDFSVILSGPPAPVTGPLVSSTATTFAAPQPRSSQQAANITGLVGMTTPNIQKSAYNPPPTNNNASTFASLSLTSTPTPATSTAYQPSLPNYFTSIPAIRSNSSSILSPQSAGGITTAPKPGSTTKSADDAFGSIWATAAASGIKKPSSAGAKAATPVQAASMADLAKSNAQSGLWGTSGTTTGNNTLGSFGKGMSGNTSTQQKRTGGDLDDLLG